MKSFCAIAAILFLAVVASAQMSNGLSDAEVQGQKFARQLCGMWPTENFTNAGILEIHRKNQTLKIPIEFETIVTATNLLNIYEANQVSQIERLLVLCFTDQPNEYFYNTNFDKVPVLGDIPILGHLFRSTPLPRDKITIPFANSDFWICDLGLEFFHWPEQKVLPKTTDLKRGRDYILLESTNPNPGNGYSRVVSWIDKETDGILEADAYDAHGKLLKEFFPKDFKKVRGQWQVQSMEMDNVQTGSRSRIEFDVKNP